MNQPDKIDGFLRESLINWALQDRENPIKQATLEHMSRPDWLNYLYSDKEVKVNSRENSKEETKEETKEERMLTLKSHTATLAFVEEEWIQNVLKHIHYALKKTYYTRFDVSKWGMRRINTTGMYVIGPMNAYGEIFFHFKIGIKNEIVYWDLENHRGKIRPKGFEGVPRVILAVLEELGHDFLIRKISKGFGVMLHSGPTSKQLLRLLLQLKEENIGIGSDAHGGMWIQEDKKKRFRLTAASNEEGVAWHILDKASGEQMASISTKEEILSCIEALNIPKTLPRKKQC